MSVPFALHTPSDGKLTGGCISAKIRAFCSKWISFSDSSKRGINSRTSDTHISIGPTTKNTAALPVEYSASSVGEPNSFVAMTLIENPQIVFGVMESVEECKTSGITSVITEPEPAI